jgi:hypothetical protein
VQDVFTNLTNAIMSELGVNGPASFARSTARCRGATCSARTSTASPTWSPRRTATRRTPAALARLQP